MELSGSFSPTCILTSHAGSNVIVAGTAIFGAPDPEGVITVLKATVNAAQAKIEAAELEINQKTQNLRRLEAQRNALNARG